ARESVDTEIGTSFAGLRVGFDGVGGQAHVRIGTRALALPNLRAVCKAVSSHATASSKLVTAEAFDHLVVRDQRSGGDGLALLRESVLDNPDFLSGLAVEGNQEAVEGAVDELAVSIRTATVDGVAASARHSRFVTVGLLHVVPNLFRVVRIRQIQSLNHVAVRHRRAA